MGCSERLHDVIIKPLSNTVNGSCSVIAAHTC